MFEILCRSNSIIMNSQEKAALVALRVPLTELFSIPHADGLEVLFAKLEEREDMSTATKDLLQMAKFVLKNNFFEFNSKIKQQNLFQPLERSLLLQMRTS